MGLIGTAVRGAAAGTLATLPMTAVMVVGERMTGYGRLPPEALVKSAAADLGDGDSDDFDDEDDDFGESEIELTWRVGHLLVGAVLGALYAVIVRPLVPFIPPVLRGALFGLAVWFVAYQGIAPALELMPRASDDDPARQGTNAAAHAVFGIVLGMLLPGRSRGAKPTGG